MKPSRAPFVLPVLALAWLAPVPAAGVIVIDQFNAATNQGPLNLVTTGTVDAHDPDTVGEGVLGSERNLQLSASNSAAGTHTTQVASGQWSMSRPAGWTAGARVVWDGEQDTNVVTHTGLGNLDLTESGANNGFVVSPATSNSDSFSLQLIVFTSSTLYSSRTFVVPSSANPVSLTFASFSQGAGAVGPADFTDVGAILLRVDPVNSETGAWNFGIDQIVATSDVVPVELQSFATE
jgi:hypothetical protein